MDGWTTRLKHMFTEFYLYRSCFYCYLRDKRMLCNILCLENTALQIKLHEIWMTIKLAWKNIISERKITLHLKGNPSSFCIVRYYSTYSVYVEFDAKALVGGRRKWRYWSRQGQTREIKRKKIMYEHTHKYIMDESLEVSSIGRIMTAVE